eukprot:g5106.t1
MTKIVYHEKQQAALCGKHCLNNLVQGPLFDLDSLAGIAHELDEKERILMLSQGSETPDALRYLASESGNVDASGNFSISVLSTALHRTCGCTLADSEHEDEKALGTMSRPLEQEAFVFNLHSHWFTVRKLQGSGWWDLNSLNDKPTQISDFYLETYLASLRNEQWRVFVVKGRLPSPEAFGFGSEGVGQNFHSVEELQAAAALARTSNRNNDIRNEGKNWGGGRTLGGGDVDSNNIVDLSGSSLFDEDEALARALAASMESISDTVADNDHEEEEAIELSCRLQLETLRNTVAAAKEEAKICGASVQMRFSEELGGATLVERFNNVGEIFDFVTLFVSEIKIKNGGTIRDSLSIASKCSVFVAFPRKKIQKDAATRRKTLTEMMLNDGTIIINE